MKTACFVITLYPENDEICELLKELETQGVIADLFPAIDGRRGMPSLELGEEVDQQKAFLRKRTPLSSSEVGCYLSHYRLIKSIYHAGIDKLCVFEDDIGIEAGLSDVLHDVYELPEEFEFVRLMGLRVRERKGVRGLPCGRLLVRPCRGLQGTQGYVVNRKGMEKILHYGRVLSLPIDIFYDTFWETNLKCYGIEPHVIYEYDLASSIKKSKEPEGSRAFLVTLRWYLGKVIKSVRRMVYLNQHRSAFSPNEKPIKKPGRTERMK